MSPPRAGLADPSPSEADPAGYTVVARRYRPQRFEDVVGQDHVVQALRNAIRLGRVTHAYLFSGTRGVGKTSIARIFAKCLNCQRGPTDDPDGTCDICRSIAVGQDVDVIEIDGASNNGVEQVRELRQNAGLRPSRARFKIYYIDEVHMLSTGAFNALLKTLEEPPEHVKFFFATTEPNKIPVTVLSRCQRYDFAGINPDQIVETLAGICRSESIEADAEALAVVARRAGGSMRDAQSLLEQLLSFGGERLTVELVQQQLGIASDDRTLDLLEALARRDPAEALRIVDATAAAGVQPTELLAGAIEFLRDAMTIAAKASVTLLAATPRQKPRLAKLAESWSIDTLLAALQILAEARGRLRGSPHGRTLVEIALFKVARLDELSDIGAAIARLAAMEAGAPPVAPPEKKKLTTPPPEPAPPELAADSAPPARSGPAPGPDPGPPIATPRAGGPPVWDAQAIASAWPAWVKDQPADVASKLTHLRPSGIEGADVLVVEPSPGYNWVVDACERADLRSKIEGSLRGWLARPVEIRFARPVEAVKGPTPSRQAVTLARSDGLAEDSLVKLVLERFEAKAVRIEEEDDPGGPPP